jgi:hypothetical protein
MVQTGEGGKNLGFVTVCGPPSSGLKSYEIKMLSAAARRC